MRKYRPARGFRVRYFPGFAAHCLLFFAFLYLPIVILVAFSFNANQSATIWTSFSLKWYAAVLQNDALLAAAKNSLIIAAIASVTATVLATLAATATSRGAEFKGKTAATSIVMLPLVLPEIVMGVAILAFFSTVGLSLGLFNLVIAHTVFCIPFAYLPVRARLQGMDRTLEQAATDLYATPVESFLYITLPLLLPGIISGWMLSFIVSLDNFIISVLVAEAGSTTLPIFIFGMVRMGVTPDLNAVSTVILAISVICVAGSYFLGSRK